MSTASVAAAARSAGKPALRVRPSGLLPRLERMHRAEFGIAVGQGDRHGVGLLALGLRQGQPDAAVGPLQMLEAYRCQLGAPQRAGESDQKDGTIAQAPHVAGDRRQQPAQNGRRGRHFLARHDAFSGGIAGDAGHGFRDADIVGRHRAAGGAVQIADRGPAQFQGFWARVCGRVRRRGRRRHPGRRRAGEGGRAGRTRRTRPGRRRGRRGGCCPPWPCGGRFRRRRARWPEVPSTTGSLASTALSNQARTCSGAAPTGAGTRAREGGRISAAPSSGSQLASIWLSKTLPPAAQIGLTRIFYLQQLYHRQLSLSVVGRRGQPGEGALALNLE